jgi:hypothetical protein
MKVYGQPPTPNALPSGKGSVAPVIGSWVGARTSLDVLEKRKFLYCWDF